MKKLIITLVVTFIGLTANAQSFELHQSYDDSKSAWGQSRLLVEYFWTSENGKWNVFSWNSYSKNGISALLYGEYQFAKNLYIHPEVRVNNGNFEYTTITPQIGLAWLIPWSGGPDIYLTPKFSHNDICASKNDFQFSINSSYESTHFYYEGYIDTNWIKEVSLFAEQKAYYKFTKNLQLGLAAVVTSVPGQTHCQPYITARVALY